MSNFGIQLLRVSRVLSFQVRLTLRGLWRRPECIPLKGSQEEAAVSVMRMRCHLRVNNIRGVSKSVGVVRRGNVGVWQVVRLRAARHTL